MSPDGKSVYVTNYGAASSSVSQFDVGTGGRLSPKTPAQIDGVPTPAGVAVSPDGRSVYVTNFGAGDHRVSQFDIGLGGRLQAKTPATVTTGSSPVAVTVSPDGRSAYVTNSGDDSISQYDVAAGGVLRAKVPATVPAGDYPYAVAVSPEGSIVLVTNADGNTISQYDVGPGGLLRVTASTASGTSPMGIAISPTRPGAPSVTISAPAEGASFPLHASVKASYACSPGGDGGALETCSGSVPNGSAIDTATVGAHSVSVTATAADGQVAVATSHYTVTAPDPPRNLTPPAIKPAFDCPVTGACRAIANTYECQPGTWADTDPARPFAYTWWRLSPDTAVLGGYRADKAATGQVYRPSASSAHEVLRQSWRFACVVEATAAGGSAKATSPRVTLTPAIDPQQPTANEDVNIRVSGIEVTQGIQSLRLSSRDEPLPDAAGHARYQGVTLAAGKLTVVRVFANFTRPATRPLLRAATAQLEVLDAGGARIALLSPASTPAAIFRPVCGLCVSETERANPDASFNFVVPWQETEHSRLSFRATVMPAAGLSAPRQCAACKANTFTLSGVPFVATATVPIHPIPLTIAGVMTSHTESEVFGDAQTVLPVQLRIFPYEAPIAVDGMDFTQALAAVARRKINPSDYSPGDPAEYPIGVFINGVRGLLGATLPGRVLYGNAPPISIVRASSRPLTSVMHEIGHGLGLVHADTAPHPDGSPDCGGNAGGQIGEAWPPDNKGRIQGFGFDRRAWDIGRAGTRPRTVVEAPGTEYYDFMSYCGNNAAAGFEASHWLSVRNWNRLLAFHAPAQALPATARRLTAADGALHVIALVGAAGQVSIFDVTPGGTAAPKPNAASPYRIEGRDAAGATLASVEATTTLIHVDGTSGVRPGLLLEATVPSTAAVTSVVVTASGEEVARRDRSPHAPTAAILSPRARVGTASTTLVRWTAGDRDGDRLATTVDYSPDGQHWKVVADHVAGTSVRVPSSALSASRRGRLRVRVSDGFQVTTAMSSPLESAGARPVVQISSGPRGRIRADAPVLLEGTAFDDTGRPLTGGRLRWYAGRRLVGRGGHLSLPRMPAGVAAVRLTATDGRGRSSQALMAIKVSAVRPAFRVASAPKRISPRARTLRLVVASNEPAVLTIAGRRHAVDRTRRTIRITVRPGRSTLRLAYALHSRGGTTSGSYVVTR